MRAMLLETICSMADNPHPLKMAVLPDPVPAENEVLIRVSVCGVCHTELDEIEGRTPPPKLPVVPGHQVVGRIVHCGSNVTEFEVGERAGVAWIYSACGLCSYCERGEENLCGQFQATGRDKHGGYAEFMTVPAAFAYRIPSGLTDKEAAPLLCAGAVGYRSLRLTGLKDGENLGLTGFGASAHLVLKLVRYQFPSSKIFVFAPNAAERKFALELGASWAGDSTGLAPEKLHAVIDTTPVWRPLIEALKNLEPGGRLVINAIRKENIDKEALLRLEYPSHLWLEKEIKTVANVTRRDVREFLELADKIPIKPEVQEYELIDANQALLDMKEKHIRGAKILVISETLN